MNTKKLRAEIQRITRCDGRRHFSKELRAKVKAAVFSLKKAGASQVKIAETLTISETDGGGGRARGTVPRMPEFRSPR